MPPYFPDRRTLIVVRAEHQAVANELALEATREPDGSPTTDLNTFTTPLRAVGGAVAVAYWSSWAMTAAHRSAVLAELGNRFKRTVTPIPLGGRVRQQDPFWVFDAEPGQWLPEDALAALGMETLPPPE